MKTIKNIATRTLIVIVTFIALSMITNTTTTAAVKPQEDVLSAADCGVSDADVVKYLGSYGYNVIRLEAISGCCDVKAYTQNSYTTTVFISRGIITGHQDDIY